MIQKSLIKEKGILRLNGIDSTSILSLLKEKHITDVFVNECKNGETWGARDLLKLDAWVLKRTYSPLTMIGYEIKCSRQDFENDQKWTSYLDLCHQFYFVCPAGLIRATDLPKQIGIIWASKNNLHTKRKAERRNPDIEKLNRLLVYIVMARSRIVSNMFERDDNEENKLEKMKNIIELSNERKVLADFIKGHIRQIYEDIKEKARNFDNREYNLKDFEDRLAKLGIVWDSNNLTWNDNMRVRNEIDMLAPHIDMQTLRDMKTTANNLNNLHEIIMNYRTSNQEDK